MGEPAENAPLILTTETPLRIAARVWFVLLFGGESVYLALLLFLSRNKSIELSTAWPLACMSALPLILGVFLAVTLSGGTWVLNNESITFHPCHGRSRTLAWSMVERVIWRQGSAALSGKRLEITFSWSEFPESQRLPARAFVEARLAPVFDLKPVSIPTPPDSLLFDPTVGWAAKLRHLAALIGLCVGLAFPWLALFATIVKFQWWEGPLVRFLLLGLAAAYGGGMLTCALLHAYHSQRPSRMIHPAWPWRLRRSEVLAQTKVKTGHSPLWDDV